MGDIRHQPDSSGNSTKIYGTLFASLFAAINMREGQGKEMRSVVSEWFEEPAVGGQSASFGMPQGF